MTNRYTSSVKSPAKTSAKNAGRHSSFNNIFLPLPPLGGIESQELEIYARFMRHVRLMPNSRPDVKILAAIQFTADYLNLSEAMIARTLADMGLRAPRRAFPENYLDHVERSFSRFGSDVGGPCASTIDMKRFWSDIGDDAFDTLKKACAVSRESVLV